MVLVKEQVERKLIAQSIDTLEFCMYQMIHCGCHQMFEVMTYVYLCFS